MCDASDSVQRAEVLLEQQGEESVDLQMALASKRQSPSFGRPNFQGGSITVILHPSFDGVGNSVSHLKKRLEEFCEEELNKIHPHVVEVQSLHSEPQSRGEFLKYFCPLTLDPNTTYQELILSKNNRAVRYSKRQQWYPDHPERFDFWPQVLSKESVCGRCYWEVEWESENGVAISVSYNGIARQGAGEECMFARTTQSWSLEFPSGSSGCFYHNNIKTDLAAPSCSRIGVYLDHSAGTLSFYSVSDIMKLLHRVHTTFTQPLYAGFGFYKCGGSGSKRIMKLCEPKKLCCALLTSPCKIL